MSGKDLLRNEYNALRFRVEPGGTCRVVLVKGQTAKQSQTRIQLPLFFTGDQVVLDIVQYARFPDHVKNPWSKRLPVDVLKACYAELKKGFMTFADKEDDEYDFHVYLVDLRQVKMPAEYRDMVDEAMRKFKS
ncbi:MAG: hypothetical protein JNK11_04525 [Alphaproteobacteria bacterium]|nr:hypothetical protein [Alphaproteobacteria bacterium]